jgi:16S rRNA (guanine527-N7)-methyltransferase
VQGSAIDMARTDQAEFEAVIGVSRETLDRLDAYVDLLKRWAPVINLIALSTVPSIWRRHLLDSAQLFLLAPENATRWADLGSGGGLPGLVVAAVAAERRPALRVTLVDSDSRKVAFIREAARVMGLDVDVLHQRIETPPAERFPVVSARALAPLLRLFPLIQPWLSPDGVALLPKGERAVDELTASAHFWHSSTVVEPSLTDKRGVVLKVSELRCVPV